MNITPDGTMTEGGLGAVPHPGEERKKLNKAQEDVLAAIPANQRVLAQDISNGCSHGKSRVAEALKALEKAELVRVTMRDDDSPGGVEEYRLTAKGVAVREVPE